MKVLHLTTHLNPGGITSYIYKLVQPLRKLGTEISVLSSGGEAEEWFQKCDVPHERVPIRTKSELHPKIYFQLPHILKIVKRERFDVIHAHTRITQIIALWIHQLTGIPYVTTCHGFFKRRLGRRLFPAWGERVIAISDAVADRLKQDFKVSEEKISLIPNGVDLEGVDQELAITSIESVKKRFGFSADDPVLGTVSRIKEDKGHAYVLRALEILKAKYPRIRLLIIGDGEYREELERLVQKMNLGEHVRLTGNILNVTELMAMMDVFVFAPFYREGFGLSLIEAMACRRPVVSTKIWAINRLIRHGETGLLVAPKDGVAIAEAISGLLEDKEQYQRLADAGRSLVESNYDIKRVGLALHQIYGELAKKE